MFVIEIALGVALGLGVVLVVLAFYKPVLKVATLLAGCLFVYLGARYIHNAWPEQIGGIPTYVISDFASLLAGIAIVYFIILPAFMAWGSGDGRTMYERWHIEDEPDITSRP